MRSLAAVAAIAVIVLPVSAVVPDAEADSGERIAMPHYSIAIPTDGRVSMLSAWLGDRRTIWLARPATSRRPLMSSW